MHIPTVLEHYIAAALWSTNDESTPYGGEPLDQNYGPDDIAPETREQMRQDVEAFCVDNAVLLAEAGVSEEQTGHDFWLTRNHHGAGFWDRGLGDVGDRLTEQCEPYGEFNLYVGDDDLIYGL